MKKRKEPQDILLPSRKGQDDNSYLIPHTETIYLFIGFLSHPSRVKVYSVLTVPIADTSVLTLGHYPTPHLEQQARMGATVILYSSVLQ